MNRLLLGTSVIAAVLGLAAQAHARVFDEVRVGAVHNLRLDHDDVVEGKEGENAEIELVGPSPDMLSIIGSPRPYLVGSFNTSDDGVNFGGVGLLWRIEFAEGWALEPGFGYIIHDGELDNPYADGSPAAAAFEEEHQLLGSRDLFRTTLALEREFGGRFAAQLYYEHMSHGQILDSGRNQGLDFVGLRFLYRFNPDAAD
jgi:lipid A 3-O-deacylase